MKKIISTVLILISTQTGFAQPTLTAANANPTLGDVFFNYYNDTATISAGASGAGVTWDFSYLSVSTNDTTTVITCGSTPYCDSFPGSSLVEFTALDSDYVYLANGVALEMIGEYSPVDLGGVDYMYLPIPPEFGPYPLTYGDNWRDTTFEEYNAASTPFFDHVYGTYFNIADGYGTLKTPAATYTNALRVHTTSYTHDTNFFYGVNHIDTNESYNWYVPGIHTPVMNISYSVSTVFGGSPAIKWSSVYNAAAVPVVQNESANFVAFPNPSCDVIHIKNTTGDMQNTEASLMDVTGREVGSASNNNQNQNELEIPVTALPVGVYLLRIHTASGAYIKKVAISR